MSVSTGSFYVFAQEQETSMFYRSCIHVEHDGRLVDVPTMEEAPLPVGSKVITHVYLYPENREEEQEALVRFENKKGLTYYPYYEGVLKIGNRNASEAEYNAFIGSGMTDYLDNYKSIRYTLEAKTSGADEHEIISSVYTVIQEAETEYQSVFEGNFEVKMHQVTFYDGDTLLASQEVRDGDSVTMPEIQKEGYNFLGFNSESDGSGIYYHYQAIQEDSVYYAIFERMSFHVNYYVDNILYTTRTVWYGEDAEFIKLSDREHQKFIGWSGNLEAVKENRNVYAIFDEVSDKPEKPEKPEVPPKQPQEETPKKPIPPKEVELPNDAIQKEVDEGVAIVVEAPQANTIELPENSEIQAAIQKKSVIEGATGLQKDDKYRIIVNGDGKNTNEVKNDVLTTSKQENGDNNAVKKIVPFVIAACGFAFLGISSYRKRH